MIGIVSLTILIAIALAVLVALVLLHVRNLRSMRLNSNGGSVSEVVIIRIVRPRLEAADRFHAPEWMGSSTIR